MIQETPTTFQIPSPYYTMLFEAIAGNNALLQIDAPCFTIVAASPSYIHQTGSSKEAMINKGIFEVFPGSNDPGNTGTKDLLASLNEVLRTKQPHQLPVQRYDTATENGQFIERYWKAINKPVFAPDGQLVYIIHSAEEITDQIKAQRREIQIEGIEKAYNLFMKVPAIISITKGPEHVLELANEGALKLWGKEKNIIGKSIVNAIPDLIGQNIVEQFDNVYKTGKPYIAGEVPIITYRSGTKEELYFDVVYQPYYEENNNMPAGVFAMSHEVTELVKAKRKVETSELKFRTLIEEAPIATCLFVGEELVMEVMNQPMIDIFGKGNHIQGMKLTDAVPEILSQPFPDILRNVIRTGKMFEDFSAKVELVRDGILGEYYFDYTYKPIHNSSGEVYAVLDMAVDVTERELAHQKIQASQQSLLNLFEESPAGIATLSGDDNFVFETANAFYGALVGRLPSEIIGKPLLEALPEIKGQGFDEILKEVISTRKPFMANEVKVQIMRKRQLENIYVNLTYQPRKQDETVTGILVIATDVTEQVVARKKIEESEQFARSLFYNSPIAVLVYVGNNMVLREANDKMLEVFGRGAEIIGKPIIEAIPELKDTPIMDHYKKVMETGITHSEKAEKILLIKNGQPYWGYYDYTYKPLYNTEGITYGVICTTLDVTKQVMARQELEEKEVALENALEQVRLSKEAAELGTFDMNMQNGDLHWDDRCRLLFGISHQQPVSYDRDFIERLHPDDKERVLGVLSRTFEKSVSNGNYDVDYRTIGAEDGIVRWVRAKGKVYFSNNDQPVRFIGSVLDITEQKTAIQKIEQLVDERTRQLAETNNSLMMANTELQRSNAHLEEFTYAASHDLKEPIRKISTFSQLLKTQMEDRFTEKDDRLLSRILTSAERMGLLVDDLLVYSHVTQKPQKTEPVDLNQKVQKVLEDLELDIAEKNAVIEVQKLPVVMGYKRQLQQLFQNLISNSIKYSKTEVAPLIKISAEEVVKSGKSIPHNYNKRQRHRLRSTIC